MTKRSLFVNRAKATVSGSSTEKDFKFAESSKNVKTVEATNSRLVPHIDFSVVDRFAKFGSAELYYKKAFDFIRSEYPYDGSENEKNSFYLSLNEPEKYIFDKIYPRSNGYAIFSADGWGSRVGSIVDGFGEPVTKEYIDLKGAPHTPIKSFSTKRQLFELTRGARFETKQEVADRAGVSTDVVPSDRKGSLKADFDEGVTVEFWLKKDSFDLTKTETEVVFDLSNGQLSSSAGYGRFTISLHGTGSGLFSVTAQSGSDGVFESRLGTSLATSSLSKFAFYSIRAYNDSSDFKLDLYKNGSRVETRTVSSTNVGEIGYLNTARIGALIASPSGSLATAGSGKLNASIDDFRYWKVKRASEEIDIYSLTPVGGGVNTDFPNTSLGVYYKFNEGITNTSSLDSKVVDYSGRINNGSWTGYGSNSRATGSAFVLSGRAGLEYMDPILNKQHPTFNNKREQLIKSGSVYDSQNASYIRNYFPQWMLDLQDDNPHLQYLTHIAGQYFDDLYLKIQELNKLQNVEYPENGERAYPTERLALESKGLRVDDLFDNASILNLFSQRDRERLFEIDLEDLKNKIYKNIYNNLSSIYKSKGTGKSFRYALNALGVPDDLYQIRLYSNFDTIEGSSRAKTTVDNIKYLSLASNDTKNSIVYQAVDSSQANSIGYLSSSRDNTKEPNYGITLESSINFPRINLDYDLTKNPDSSKQKSLFGMVQHNPSGSSFLASDTVNLQVYAEKERRNSKDARFVLTSSISPNRIPELTSPYFKDVFNDSDWHIAVSVVPSNYPFNSSVISGSEDHNYTVIFQGQTRTFTNKAQSFYLTSSVSKTIGQDLLKNQKRAFVGAYRQNFTGSVNMVTQAKFNMFNIWNIGLSNTDIDNHAADLNNRSITNATVLRKSLETTAVNEQIAKNSTLALSWGFEKVTGSNSTGNFFVYDESSGSAESRTINNWFGENYGFIHSGYGFGFPQSSNEFVTKEKRQNITFTGVDFARNSFDDVQSVLSDDVFFQRNSAPSDTVLRIENSPYSVVSKDMVDYFGVFSDLNEHMGAPVQRYRHSYKQLRNLATNYFRSVNTEVDVQKYFDYFKWFDTSVTNILKQLVPLSMNFEANSPNTIESHILERNKFQSKYQNIKSVNTVVEGSAKGVNELDYNWRLGHAPVGLAENQNSIWWKLRADRDDVLSVDSSVDPSRDTIRRITVTNVSGSTFAVRNLTRPVRLGLSETKTIRGGTNFERAKSIDFTYSSLRPAGPVNKDGGIFVPQNVLLAFGEDLADLKAVSDVTDPNKKTKRYAKVFQGRGYNSGLDYESSKNTFSFPFNILSSSVDSGYQSEVQDKLNNQNMEITNLHNDVYGPDMEKPMQGPFTEQHVGGHQSRHIKLNKGNDSWKDRPEAWKLLLGRCVTNKTAIGMVGPDYPYPEANREGESPYPLTAAHKAPFYRDGTAKRSVNIANLKNGDSLGNYDQNWEVVHTFGRKNNNRVFDKNQPVLPKRIADTLPKTTQVKTILDSDYKRSGHFDYENDTRVFSQSANNRSVIANRFSAPGDPLTMTEGFLDYDGREFSSYNDLNYRNITVRGFGHEVSASGGLQKGAIDIHGNNLSMRAHLVRHTGRFGRDSVIVPEPQGLRTEAPGYHKVHRNSLTRINSTYDIRDVLVAPGLTNTNAMYFGKGQSGAGNQNCVFIGQIDSGGSDRSEAARSSSIGDFYDNGFTFSAWIRTKNIDTSVRTFYSHGSDGGNPILMIEGPSGGLIKTIIKTANNPNPLISLSKYETDSVVIPPPEGDDDFYHLLVTVSGSNGSLDSTLTVKVYINGVNKPVSRNDSGGSYGAPGPDYADHDQLVHTSNFRGFTSINNLRSLMILGGRSSSQNGFNFSGSMDEVSIWATPLNPHEVSAIYNGGVPCNITSSLPYENSSSTLKVWYRMGDATNDAISPSNIGYYQEGTNSIINFAPSIEKLEGTPMARTGSPQQSEFSPKSVKSGCPPIYEPREFVSYECGDIFDNAYVVHSLPRSENQYSWITASYVGNCSGTINIGYQPYNTWEYGTDVSGTNPYELATEGPEGISTHFSSKNNEYSLTNDTISVLKDSALDNPLMTGSQRQLNAFLNNYNGPYQAPTFVFRNMLGVNPLVNRARAKNVIPYVLESTDSNIFVSESVVSNHLPVVIKKVGPVAQGQVRSAKVSFGLENDTFDSPVLRDRIRRSSGQPISTTLYRNEGMDFLLGLNLFTRNSELTMKEQIYPAKSNRYLEKVKKRDSYFNFFWRDSREERSNLGTYSTGLAHTNSRGYNPIKLNYRPPAEDPSSGASYHRESIWPLDPIINFETRTRLTSSRSTLIDTDRLPISGAGELQNQYSQVCFGSHGGVVNTAQGKMLHSTILYSRKHDVASSGSVRHPTGLDFTLESLETPGLSSAPSKTGLGERNYAGTTHMFAGDAFWDAPSQAKIIRTLPTETDRLISRRTVIERPSAPWFDSYDEYLNGELETVSKEYSIIPEFRISKKTEESIKNQNESTLLLEIVNGTSSVALPNSSSEFSFFRTFTNSSFITDYEKMVDSLNNSFDLESISLECSGVMKFLPYDGFYPAQRTVQIASDFNFSYGSVLDSTEKAGAFLGSSVKSYRPIYQALFSPGILFNSIKSGMAVDYPQISKRKSYRRLQLEKNRKFVTNLVSGRSDYYLGEIAKADGVSSLFHNARFDNRIPFEAILNPAKYMQGQELKDNEIHKSASLDFTASISSTPDNELYHLSVTNFISSVQEFFLAPREEVEITSKRIDVDSTQKISLKAGATYMARVSLRRSLNRFRNYSNDNFDSVESFGEKGAINHNIGSFSTYPIPQDPKFDSGLKETFTMYSRASAFGPPMSGRVKEINVGTSHDGSGVGSSGKANTEFLTRSVSDSLNGFNWAFTPPYYNGEAWADLILHVPTASTTGEAARGVVNYTLKEIQEDIKIKCWRADPGITGSAGTPSANYSPNPGELFHAGSGSTTEQSRRLPYSPRNINYNAMQLTSSFDIALLRETKGDNITSQQWVIRPKFLTPMLNFNSYEDNSSITTTTYGRDSIPRGMWHQFGLIPDVDEGVYCSISDIPNDWLTSHPDGISRNSVYNNGSRTGWENKKIYSLTDALGFDTSTKKLGALKNSKEVFEGVVAVPYLSGERNQPIFFKHSKNRIKDALANFDNQDNDVSENAIIKTLKFARKFVLPEQFDPFTAAVGTEIGDPEAALFKMFFFEFKATLSKNDLSYIWQNLMPRDFEQGLDAKRIYVPQTINNTIDLSDRISLSDSLELRDPQILNNISNLRWMIFKVKQRGVADFDTFNQDVVAPNFVRRQLIDFNEVSRSFQNLRISSETLRFDPNPKLAFNWPYDYFSLTEKVKINAKLKFKN